MILQMVNSEKLRARNSFCSYCRLRSPNQQAKIAMFYDLGTCRIRCAEVLLDNKLLNEKDEDNKLFNEKDEDNKLFNEKDEN
jgi:hypothetical protein